MWAEEKGTFSSFRQIFNNVAFAIIKGPYFTFSFLVGSMENRIYPNSFTFRAQIYKWWLYLWGKSYITVTTVNNKIQISTNYLKTKYCKNHISHEEVLNVCSQKVYIKIIPCLGLLTTTTKHHRLGGLNNRNLFLTVSQFWSLGILRWRLQQGKFHFGSFFSCLGGMCHHTVCSHDLFFVHMLERNHELSEVWNHELSDKSH